MLNTPRSRWIAVGALAAVLVAAGTAVAGDRDGEGRRGRKHRRQGIHRALKRIDALSDEQARAAFDASRDLVRIREEVRAKTAAVLVQAHRDAKAAPDRRAAIREAARAKLKALREEYRAPFTEAGMKVVKTLTPEQRAAIAKRRPSVTDEQLARFLGMRLSRPWAGALLKARVEGGATTPPR